MKPEIRIVVLPYGHVIVGLYSSDNLHVVVERAHVIRKWGTTGGLPQLAREGPTKETVLDGPGTCRHLTISEIYTLDCDPEKWTATLEGSNGSGDPARRARKR